MRETIVCIGEIAQHPHIFPETGIAVQSYEELCYYMRNHLICYLYTLPDEKLARFVAAELKLDKLSRTLSRLTDPAKDQMKYFAALFREGNYYSEDEIRGILDEYRTLKNADPYQQGKWLGDLFFSSGRAAMAVSHYEAALEQEGPTDAELGTVHHNLACALIRLFRFGDARIHLLKAWQYGEDERSLYYYYAIMALQEGLDKAREELKTFEVSDLVMESFENRFAQMQVSFQSSDAAARFRKMFLLSQAGREDDCIKIRDRYIRKMQKDFRPEMESPEYLFVMNPLEPVNNKKNIK